MMKNDVSAKARLYATAVASLIEHDWHVGKATPDLIVTVHNDKQLLGALLHSAITDPMTAPYCDEMLSADLVRLFAQHVAKAWANRSERVEAGNE